MKAKNKMDVYKQLKSRQIFTVGELIEKLQEFPKDTKISSCLGHFGGNAFEYFESGEITEEQCLEFNINN